MAENLFFCQFILIILFCCFNAHSQKNTSVDYNSIIENKRLSKSLKISKIDSLLSHYETLKEYEKLFDDIYYYAIWYFNSGDYETAIETCNKGIDISKKFINPHPNRLAGLKNTIGASYLYTGNYESAFNTYKNIVETVKIDYRIANAYHYMAECKNALGDYYTAIEYYDLSISKAKELDDKTYHIGFVINETANYYQIANKKLKQKGIESLKQILKLTEIDTNYSKVFYPYYETLILRNIGGLQQELSDSLFDKAKQYYIRALKIAVQHNIKEEIGGINNALGYISMKQNTPETLTYLNKASQFIEDVENQSICYSNKAFYFSNNNRFEEALSNTQKAISLLVKFDTSNNYNSPSIDAIKESPYKRELLTALIDKAEILMIKNKVSQQGKDISTALELLNLADKLTQIIRLESNTTNSKLFWRTISSRIYTNAVDICYKLNDNDKALYYIEKNKALLLLEDINQKRYLKSTNLPSQILQKYSQLKNDITKQTQLLDKNYDNDSIRLALITSKNTLQEFTDSLLTTKYSPYFKPSNLTKVISLKETKQILNKNTANINYILNDDKGYGIVITNKNHFLFKIKDINSLKTLTKDYQNLLTRPLNSKTDLKKFNIISKQLHTLLIPENIQSFIKEKDLIISPDYYLQNIPFETLKNNSNAYLLENHNISYTYSLTFLNTNSKIDRQNSKEFIGFAPIDFGNNLSNLTRTKGELEGITKVVSGQVFYNNNATTNSFTKHIQDYNIIHLATHANASDSIRPWIAFKDKLLTLDELYLTKNSAELVVLSACETGLGELKQGEGVMSLARGFFNTGANTVVSSLWNVNDKSSSEIIVDFYKNLESGDSKSVALHKAKLNYINKNDLSDQSPYYWASFVMIGDTSPINSIQSNYSAYLLIGLGFILLALFFFFKFKK